MVCAIKIGRLFWFDFYSTWIYLSMRDHAKWDTVLWEGNSIYKDECRREKLSVSTYLGKSYFTF